MKFEYIEMSNKIISLLKKKDIKIFQSANLSLLE